MDEATARSIVSLVATLAERGGPPTTHPTLARRPPRRRRRPTPPARARLALDAAALLAGLRPALLLDYGGPAFRDEAGLAELAAGLGERCGGGGGSVRAVRLGSGDGEPGLDAGPALFLVRLPLCGPLPPPAPWRVRLSGGGDTVWDPDPESLAPGLAAVAAVLDRDAGESGGAAHPPLDLLPHPHSSSAPPPSALAAWLLGYPAALVPGGGGGGGGPASATLVALRAAPPPALAAALAGAGWPLPAGVLEGAEGGGGGRVDVSSFALPAGRPGDEDDARWLGAWTASVRARAAGTGWSGVGLVTGGMGAGGLVV